MNIFFIFLSDDWFSRNHVHHPTMRKNHRDTRSGLTRRVLYFIGQQILTRSSMCIEDNNKNLLVLHKYLVKN